MQVCELSQSVYSDKSLMWRLILCCVCLLWLICCHGNRRLLKLWIVVKNETGRSCVYWENLFILLQTQFLSLHPSWWIVLLFTCFLIHPSSCHPPCHTHVPHNKLTNPNLLLCLCSIFMSQFPPTAEAVETVIWVKQALCRRADRCSLRFYCSGAQLSQAVQLK